MSRATGDQTPASVLDTLNQHCNGDTCDTQPWTIQTSMTNDAAGDNDPNNINAGTITVTVSDATIGTGDDLAGIIEALKGLANQPQITTTTTEYYCDTSDDTLSPPSRIMRRGLRNREFGCNNPSNGTPIQQYSSAGKIHADKEDIGGE